MAELLREPAFAIVTGEWLKEASVLFVTFGIIDPVVAGFASRPVEHETLIVILLILVGIVFFCLAVACEYYLRKGGVQR
jgi:hypothetical protein